MWGRGGCWPGAFRGPLCPCPTDLSTRVHTGPPASCRACTSSPEGLLYSWSSLCHPWRQATMPQNEENTHGDDGWEPACTRKYPGSLTCGAASLRGTFCTDSPSVPSGVTLRCAPVVAWNPTLSPRPFLPRLTPEAPLVARGPLRETVCSWLLDSGELRRRRP